MTPQRQQHFFSFEPLRLQRIESMMANPLIKEAQHRWGLDRQTRLCAFRFESGTEGNNNSSSTVVAGYLRFSGFHRGLLHEFLCSFFNAPEVQKALSLPGTSESVISSRVKYHELTCDWTTLLPFKRLVEAGVVRRAEAEEKGRNKESDDDDTEGFDGVRMPVVKRLETYLPHDIIVSDELRALFLFAHNNAVCRGESEDGCDYDDIFGYNEGGHLSTAALARVFDEAERAEFLYHILWRLVAGGGTTNQWDDELTVYLEAARVWYKGLVGMRAVPASVNGAGMNEVDRAAEDVGGTLVPEVVSTVVSVEDVEGLPLFHRSDDAEPSNLNYCYVCIDPLQAVVVVWYHFF